MHVGVMGTQGEEVGLAEAVGLAVPCGDYEHKAIRVRYSNARLIKGQLERRDNITTHRAGAQIQPNAALSIVVRIELVFSIGAATGPKHINTTKKASVAVLLLCAVVEHGNNVVLIVPRTTLVSHSCAHGRGHRWGGALQIQRINTPIEVWNQKR